MSDLSLSLPQSMTLLLHFLSPVQLRVGRDRAAQVGTWHSGSQLMVRVICILDHSSALRNDSIDRGISRLEDVVAGGLWQISRVVSANKDRRVRS